MKEKSLIDKYLNGITYDEWLKHKITEQDIIDFKDLYNEFIKLETKYKESMCGRVKVAKDIYEKSKLLESLSAKIKQDCEIKNDSYKHLAEGNAASTPYDYLELIKELANYDKEKYDIKTIDYETCYWSERHGYRECSSHYQEQVRVLSEKDVLEKIPSSFGYSYQLNNHLKELYEQGASLFLAGGDSLSGFEISGLEYRKFCQINMYLHDESIDYELANAIELFSSFADENGYDISNIDKDELVEFIRSNYSVNSKKAKQKVLSQRIRY